MNFYLIFFSKGLYCIKNDMFKCYGMGIVYMNTWAPAGGGKRGHLPPPPGNLKIWGPPQ